MPEAASSESLFDKIVNLSKRRGFVFQSAEIYGGFRSAVWYAPESGITVALGVNQAATDPNILATRAFDAILTQLGR